jgi:hypothetical protein
MWAEICRGAAAALGTSTVRWPAWVGAVAPTA